MNSTLENSLAPVSSPVYVQQVPFTLTGHRKPTNSIFLALWLFSPKKRAWDLSCGSADGAQPQGAPAGIVLWTCKVAQKTRPLGVWRHSEGWEAAALISLFISFQFGKRGCLTTNVPVSCLAAALGEPLEKPGRKPPVLYSEQGLAWGHTLNNGEKTKYWIAACSANPVPLGRAGPCVRECVTWGSFPLALGTSPCTQSLRWDRRRHACSQPVHWEGSQLGTSVLAPHCSTECKTTFLLSCGLAWKTLSLQRATWCGLMGCCSGLREPTAATRRDLWCSARRSCLPALSSLVLKEQNVHHQNSVHCLDCSCSSFPTWGLCLMCLSHWFYQETNSTLLLAPILDSSLAPHTVVPESRVGSPGRQWAKHEGCWGFCPTFSLQWLCSFCLWPNNQMTQMSLLDVSGMPENSNPLMQALSWGSRNPR